MTEMLTAKDMQTLLQVDRSTIYRMAEAGQLPAIKVGKQWRFPGEMIEQWFKIQAASPPATPVPASTDLLHNGQLASMLPLACVQLIQDTYADALEVMMVITDMAGNPVTQISRPCGLFSAISAAPNAFQKCVDSWRDLASAIELEPKFVPSHLGLLCARGMIRLGNRLEGMVIVSGIAPDRWPPAPQEIEAMAAHFEVTSPTLAAHIEEVFYLDPPQRAKTLSFVQRIANVIAHIATERYVLMGKLEAIADLTR